VQIGNPGDAPGDRELGALRCIALIEAAEVICPILGHLGGERLTGDRIDPAPPGRGPPPGALSI